MSDRHDGQASRSAAFFVALIGGLAVFSLFFTDSQGSQSLSGRLLIATAVAILAGTIVGWMRPGSWLPAGVLATWGSVVSGLMLLFMRQSLGLWTLLVPTAATLCGAFLGSWGIRLRIRHGVRQS